MNKIIEIIKQLKGVKKIFAYILLPFIFLYSGIVIMIALLGKAIYKFADLMSGYLLNNGDWSEDF